jgi:hypothetical protein
LSINNKRHLFSKAILSGSFLQHKPVQIRYNGNLAKDGTWTRGGKQRSTGIIRLKTSNQLDLSPLRDN